mmetsp:Transcript_80984/g.153141  ORF Transcript_80984/g.153141 Transcript_80984/m.153141 type:complete len:623 (-) Transcript_80984:102-1970(-)
MGGGASATAKHEPATVMVAPAAAAPAGARPNTGESNSSGARRRKRGSTIEERSTRASVINNMKERATGNRYDLCVLGAGPAGMKAAVEAGSRGQRVALIDPKELIHGAPTGAHSKCLREAVLLGAKTWDKVDACLNRATKLCIDGCAQTLKIYHVEHLRGTAKLLDANSLEFHPHKPEDEEDALPQRVFRFEMLVIATGSKSNRFPPVPFDWPGCYDSDTINNITRIPERILVQGAGIIGLEYGLIFRKLGTEVIIVEAFDKVVPMLDVSLQQACLDTMKKEGVEIILKCPIKGVTKADGHSDEAPRYKVEIEDRVIECDCILSCCGRHGCSEGLGLEALEPAGLKVGRGKMIQVDKNCWTGVGNIYAVGDVVGGNLATIGQAHAVRAIRCRWGSGMISKERGKDVKPSGVWTIPELAWAGITEQKAVEDGLNFGSVVVPYSHTVRGCVTNQEGFLKLVYDRDNGKALGVHLFGENSCDLVNYGAEVVNDGDTIFEMLQMVFPAVTYHELYNLAATEAKIYMRHKDARDVQAAASWRRVKGIITNAMKKIEADACPDVELAKVFRTMDEDNSGFITHPQMKKAMETFGLFLSDEEIHAMILEATGGEDDNNVDYEEFLKMVK